jgi:peroxiredoxin
MTAKSAAATVFALASLACAQIAFATPRVAPDFTWVSGGKTVHLKDLRGHVVVVNFFATWCGPCRQETPAFVRAAGAYSARGVYFVGVDSGDESVKQVVDFAQKNGISYQLVVDTQGQIEGAYGVDAFPTTFILNTDGNIIFHTVGPMAQYELSGALDGFLAGAQ